MSKNLSDREVMNAVMGGETVPANIDFLIQTVDDQPYEEDED